MADAIAPASRQASIISATSGCRRRTGAWRSFASVRGPAGQPTWSCACRRTLAGNAGRAVLIKPSVGIRRAHAERGLDQDDAKPGNVRERIDLVASPGADGRSADKKIRHVGTERRGKAHEFLARDPKRPDPVQADERRGRVRAPAAQSRRDRNALLERDLRVARLAAAARRAATTRWPRARRGSSRRPAHPTTAVFSDKRAALRRKRQRVGQVDRLKDRLNVVEPVRPPCGRPEA